MAEEKKKEIAETATLNMLYAKQNLQTSTGYEGPSANEKSPLMTPEEEARAIEIRNRLQRLHQEAIKRDRLLAERQRRNRILIDIGVSLFLATCLGIIIVYLLRY